MDTRFAISSASTCIAFDVSGAGTPILLLHGGGGSRRDWHVTGYVERLQDDFTVIPIDLRARWMPIVEAAGNAFDPSSLSEQDQQGLGRLISPGELFPSLLAWSTAMLTWDTLRPSDLLCPTLWLMGSQNDKALDTLREYEHEIPESNIQVHILERLNHGEEFEAIDQVLPIILSFIKQEK